MRVTDRIALWREHSNLSEFGSIKSVIQTFCKKIKEENVEMGKSSGTNQTNMKEDEGKKRKKVEKRRGAGFKVNKWIKKAYQKREKMQNEDNAGISSKTNNKIVDQNDERVSMAIEVLMNMPSLADSTADDEQR